MSALADTTPDMTETDQPSDPGATEQPADTRQPDPAVIAARPVIAVALLTAHPGNVRRTWT